MTTIVSVRHTARLGPALTILLSALMLLVVILGPLVTGRIRFRLSSDAVAQYVGGEMVTLVLAVLLGVAALAWWSGRGWAPAAAGGAGAFVVYTMATVVAGQEYQHYEGNAEKAFLLYAAVTATAVLLIVASFRAMLALPRVAGAPHRAALFVLVTLSGVFALLWVAQVVGFLVSGPSTEYLSSPALFWLVKFLDLGIVIPLIVLVALAQRAPTGWSDAATVVVLVFMCAMLAAVLGMAVEMLRRGLPGASWVMVALCLLLLVPAAVVTLQWLAALEVSVTGP